VSKDLDPGLPVTYLLSFLYQTMVAFGLELATRHFWSRFYETVSADIYGYNLIW
jgi:hypothetical protein